ncbi:hypothetical protein ACSSV1_005773 [Labrenzia sp. MBR-25]|jgi:hypothetical protein
MPLFARSLLTASALVLAAGAAHATPAIGLAGDKTLVVIDSNSGKVTEKMEVSGVDSLLGIDLRPATGQLIGVSAAHEIVEIDPKTGAATVISKMDKMLPLKDGQPVIVDFNPKANKLRFMTGVTNHRVDIESGEVTVDGSLAFEEKDMHAGETPNIVAAAYINSYGQPETTAMYDIDATIGAVIRQTSPNDGTLAAVGKLGVDAAETYAFDVATDAEGNNKAWLATGTWLHTVSLETGKVTGSWELGGLEWPLRDITFMTAL